MRRHNEVSLDALRADTEFEPIDPTGDIEQQLIDQDEKDELKAAVNKLSTKDNALITEIYYDEVFPQRTTLRKTVSASISI